MGQPNSNSRPRRRGVKRTICAGLFLSSILIGYAAYQHFVDPKRIQRLAEDFLERITQRKVHIASASFSLTQGIHLRDVFVSNQPLQQNAAIAPTISEEVFSCSEISILHNSWALLGGRLEIESFAAIQPTLTLVHDSNVGWADVSDLVRTMISRQKTTGSAPPIELRQARVRIIHRSPAGDREVEDFQLTVRGRRAIDNPRLFNVVWQDATDPDANGHTQIDLVTGYIRNVRGGLPTMSIRGVMLAVDAGFEGADALTDLLGIDGRVRVRDYNLMKPPLHEGPRSATIDLKHASISIPISEEERPLKTDDRYLRFSSVDGSVTMTASSIEADFDALFHGSDCKVMATVSGPLKPGITLASLMMNANVTVKSFDLPNRLASPQERRFIQRWPDLGKFFDNYDPHGKVDLDFQIAKGSGENEKFDIRKALFTAQGGDASFRNFPYRVNGLSGAVEFGADGLFLRNLCGLHESARVCVNGWMETPRRTSPAQFSIAGIDVPIDEDFLTALDPHERRWVEEAGLAGRFDADVSVSRARSINSEIVPWDTVIEVAFTDLSAIHEQVPLPVTHLAGRARIDRDRLEISQIQGNVGDGSIRLSGVASMGNKSLRNVSMRVEVEDVKLDQDLLSAIPAEISTQIAPYNLTGCVSADSSLDHTPANGWRHVTNVQLRNLDMMPEVFPLPLERGLADLRLESDHIEIVRARAFFDEGRFFAKGRIGLGTDTVFNIVVEADNVPLNEQFRAAAPPSLRDALADWRFDQPLDAEIRIRKPGGNLTWNGRARIADNTIHHRALPFAFEDVQASISFSKDDAHCSDARARYAGAAIDADFSFTAEGEARRGQLRIGAKALALDESVRDALPPDAQRVWDKISPTGEVDLALDDLGYYRAEKNQQPTWSIRGHALPHAVTLGGNEVALDQGLLRFEGMLADRLGGVTLNGSMQKSEVTLYGQQLTDANANWYLARTARGEGRAAIRELQGDLHGGKATTQAQLQFNRDHAQYRLATSIQNVQLASWIESWRTRNPAPENQSAARRSDKASDVRGLMDAQVHLSGVIDQPQTRTGGGRVDIRDGYIYKLPIFLAILNVLDITVPNNDVLSEAHGQFYVTGNTVRLADIEITGESLSLVGTGSMSLSDQSVDLTFVNAGAGRLAGVPVLAELWEGASREMVEIRVTGPVSQPQVRTSPFRGVTDEFKKLFQKRKPRRSLQAVNP
jgi:hypothetical protein